MINNPLTSLFGKSPIKPLQEHMSTVVLCAKQLVPFMNAAIAGDWEAAETIHESISDAEKQADQLKKQLRLQLPKSLFMPVSRSDLLELLTEQDKVANCTRDITGIMLGRRMQIPEALQDQIQEFVVASVNVAQQALTAINELDELLETGFSGGEMDFVEQLIERLNDLEDTTDILERELRHKLFDLEKDLPPVDVMFLYQTIDGIGELANRAESVGGRLQLLVAR